MGDLFGGGGAPNLQTPTRDISQLEQKEAQSRSEAQSKRVRAATSARKRGRALLLADDVTGVNVNTGNKSENLGG